MKKFLVFAVVGCLSLLVFFGAAKAITADAKQTEIENSVVSAQKTKEPAFDDMPLACDLSKYQKTIEGVEFNSDVEPAKDKPVSGSFPKLQLQANPGQRPQAMLMSMSVSPSIQLLKAPSSNIDSENNMIFSVVDSETAYNTKFKFSTGYFDYGNWPGDIVFVADFKKSLPDGTEVSGYNYWRIGSKNWVFVDAAMTESGETVYVYYSIVGAETRVLCSDDNETWYRDKNAVSYGPTVNFTTAGQTFECHQILFNDSMVNGLPVAWYSELPISLNFGVNDWLAMRAYDVESITGHLPASLCQKRYDMAASFQSQISGDAALIGAVDSAGTTIKNLDIAEKAAAFTDSIPVIDPFVSSIGFILSSMNTIFGAANYDGINVLLTIFYLSAGFAMLSVFLGVSVASVNMAGTMLNKGYGNTVSGAREKIHKVADKKVESSLIQFKTWRTARKSRKKKE